MVVEAIISWPTVADHWSVPAMVAALSVYFVIHTVVFELNLMMMMTLARSDDHWSVLQWWSLFLLSKFILIIIHLNLKHVTCFFVKVRHTLTHSLTCCTCCSHFGFSPQWLPTNQTPVSSVTKFCSSLSLPLPLFTLTGDYHHLYFWSNWNSGGQRSARGGFHSDSIQFCRCRVWSFLGWSHRFRGTISSQIQHCT